ncbi:hypothetical protein F1737_04610 [Methanoplanus sp. FWC-SCC4]|uniref:Tetratricopeptide repeat protein n=1 Tax=Methanochimaera problematica TaxID=2609417 RepID=A0AA97I474_9EURY|nr:hypothetical protein [Methanoplanus sp. FWC-SCC4]WOF16036.1 hypothetical protein F1737_04610 [Methanoplanus sp. FWC-SCC4]
MNGHENYSSFKDSGMIMQIPSVVFQWSLYELHRIKKIQTIQENAEYFTDEEITDVNNQLGRMSCFLYQLASDAGTLQNVYHELKKGENQKFLEKTLIYVKNLQNSTSTGYAEYYFPQDGTKGALKDSKKSEVSEYSVIKALFKRHERGYSDLLFPAGNIFNDNLIKYLLEYGNIGSEIHPVLKYLSKYPKPWNNLDMLEYFTNQEKGTELKLSWQEYFVSEISTPYYYNLKDGLAGFNSNSATTPDAKSDLNEFSPRDFFHHHNIHSPDKVYAPFMKEIRDKFASEFSVPVPSDFWYGFYGYSSGSYDEKYTYLRYHKFTTDVLTIAAEFWFSEKSSDEQVEYLNHEKRFEIIPEDISEWPISWFERGLLEGISSSNERIVAIKQILSRDSLTEYETFVWTLFLGDSLWLCEDSEGTRECYNKAHEILSGNLDNEEFILNESERRCQYCFPTWCDLSGFIRENKPKRYTQDDFKEIVSIKKCLSYGNTNEAEEKILNLTKSLPERTSDAKAIILNHLYAIAEEMGAESYLPSFKSQFFDLWEYVRKLRFKEINSRLEYADPDRRTDFFQFTSKYKKAKVLIGSGKKEYKDGMAEAGRCLYHISRNKIEDCPVIYNALDESIKSNQKSHSLLYPPLSEAYFYLCKVISGEINSGREVLFGAIEKWLGDHYRKIDDKKKKQCIFLLEFIAVEVKNEKSESLKECLFPLFDCIMESVDNYYEIVTESSIKASIIPLCKEWFEQKIADAERNQPAAISSSDPDVISKSLHGTYKKSIDNWFSKKRDLHFGLASLKEYSGDITAIEEYKKPNLYLVNWLDNAKKVLDAAANTTTDQKDRCEIKWIIKKLDVFKEDTSIYERIGVIYMNQLDFESAWECFKLAVSEGPYNNRVLHYLVELDSYLEDHVRVEAIEGCSDAVISFKSADYEYFTICRDNYDENFDFSGPVLKYAKGLESLLDEKIWSGVVSEFGSDDELEELKGMWWISPSLIAGENRHSFSLGSWHKMIWKNIFKMENYDKNTPDLIVNICNNLSDNYSTECLNSIEEACSAIVEKRNEIAHGDVLSKSELNAIREDFVIRLNTLIQQLWGSTQKKRRWDDSMKSCDLLFKLGSTCEYDGKNLSALKYYNRCLEIKPWSTPFLSNKAGLCKELAEEAKKNHNSILYADYMDMANDANKKYERYSHINDKIRDYTILNISKKYGPAKKILDELERDEIVVEDKLVNFVVKLKLECNDYVKDADEKLRKAERLLKKNPENKDALCAMLVPLYQLGRDDEIEPIMNKVAGILEDYEDIYNVEYEYLSSVSQLQSMWHKYKCSFMERFNRVSE